MPASAFAHRLALYPAWVLLRFSIPRSAFGWVATVVIWAIAYGLIAMFYRDPSTDRGAALLVIIAGVPATFIAVQLESMREAAQLRQLQLDDMAERARVSMPHWATVNRQLEAVVATMPHEQAVTAIAIVRNAMITLPAEWDRVRATDAALRANAEVSAARERLRDVVGVHHAEMVGIVGILNLMQPLVPEDLEPTVREGVVTALMERHLADGDYRLLVAPIASIQPDLMTR